MRVRTIPTNHFLIILFSLIFLFACGKKDKKIAPPQAGRGGDRVDMLMRVDAFIVTTQTITEAIVIPGTIVANESTEIHPEVSGRVTGLYVREGAQVGKGALIAKLYDGDLQAQKRKLEVQLKIAKTTADRLEQLLKIGGISKQDYDLAALQVNNLNADVDIIRTSISKTEVRAPFSGKLGLKEISTGAYVTPQSIITTIQKTTGLRVDFNVPQKYTSQIKKGQYVNFSVEGNNKVYSATVMATESGIAEDTRSLTIRALVKGDEAGLIPGGFAKVKLSFEPNENALMIPTQAIIPQARGKRVYVYKDGRADFVEVSTGVRDSAKVEITSGLAKGDTVITTGLLGLKPDAKVTIKQIINNPSRPASKGEGDKD